MPIWRHVNAKMAFCYFLEYFGGEVMLCLAEGGNTLWD